MQYYRDRGRISQFVRTDTRYLALTGELWGVYCDDMGENWPRYNGTALYMIDMTIWGGS